MRLHRSIPDSEIPSPLKEPLIFGNREQIEALNAMEADMVLMGTEQAKITDEKLKRFDVTVEYGGTQEIRVLAVDADDAKEKAKEKADYDQADMEIDSVSAREVKS